MFVFSLAFVSIHKTKLNVVYQVKHALTSIFAAEDINTIKIANKVVFSNMSPSAYSRVMHVLDNVSSSSSIFCF